MKKTFDLMIAFKVKEVIASSLQRRIEEINIEDRIFKDLCDGALDEAFLLHDLESSFSCAFSEADVEGWVTVGDVIATMSQMPEVRKYFLANQ